MNTLRSGVAASLLAAPLLLGGCSSSWVAPRYTAEKSLEIDAPPRPMLDVRVIAGDIEIDPHDEQVVRVSALLRGPDAERLEGARLTAKVDEALVRIRVEWPGGRRQNESAELTIHSPTSQAVTARTSSGDIDVEQMAGPLAARTASGDIVVRSHEGDVEVETGSGDVDCRAVAGGALVRTGSGDVRLEAVAGPVESRTGSGDQWVELGESNAGPVTVRAGSGDVDLRLHEAFRGRLMVATGSGDLSFGPLPAGMEQRVVRMSDDDLVVVLGGEETPESSVSTGSGDVRVRPAR